MSLISAVAAVRRALDNDAALSALEDAGGTIAFDAPQSVVPDALVRMVYADAGNGRLRTHAAETGVSGVTFADTIRIDVVTFVAELPEAYNRLLPYVDPIRLCILRNWTNIVDRIEGQVAHLGDPRTPGSVAPLRWTIEPIKFNGADYLALRYALDVAIEDEVS